MSNNNWLMDCFSIDGSQPFPDQESPVNIDSNHSTLEPWNRTIYIPSRHHKLAMESVKRKAVKASVPSISAYSKRRQATPEGHHIPILSLELNPQKSSQSAPKFRSSTSYSFGGFTTSFNPSRLLRHRQRERDKVREIHWRRNFLTKGFESNRQLSFDIHSIGLTSRNPQTIEGGNLKKSNLILLEGLKKPKKSFSVGMRKLVSSRK